MINSASIRVCLLLSLFIFSVFAKAGLSPKYLESAADSGDVTAQLLLAEMYFSGDDETKKNFEKAAYWYKQAALQHDAEGQYFYASLLATGKGEQRNLPAACEYYEKSAQQGYSKAQFETGNCYSQGKGGTQNASIAAVWYQKAAKNGHKEASSIIRNNRQLERYQEIFRQSPSNLKQIEAKLSAISGREFRSLSSVQQKTVNDLASKYVQRYAIDFLKKLAVPSRNISGYLKLQSLKSSNSTIIGLLSAKQQKKLLNSIDASLQTTVSNIKTDYLSQYQSDVVSIIQPRDALRASIIFEKRAKADFKEAYTKAIFKPLLNQRESHRLQLYKAIAPSLLEQINRFSYYEEFNSFVDSHIWPNDNLMLSAESVYSAIAKKKREIAPFDTLAADDYFNSIYSGNWRLTREIDKEFVRPYVNMLRGSIDAMGALIDGFAALAGKQTNYRAELLRELESASLIMPLLSVYLLDYPTRYRKCLEPSAVVFKKTTTTETVTKNGFGVVVDRVTNNVSTDYVVVNRRFANIYEKVGLSDPESSGAGLLDTFFQGSNTSTKLSTIIASSKQFMREYDCKSPIVQRMEEQMIYYFDNYRTL